MVIEIHNLSNIPVHINIIQVYAQSNIIVSLGILKNLYFKSTRGIIGIIDEMKEPIQNHTLPKTKSLL